MYGSSKVMILLLCTIVINPHACYHPPFLSFSLSLSLLCGVSYMISLLCTLVNLFQTYSRLFH